MNFPPASPVLPHPAQVHRLVPSHFPPIALFESVAVPEDMDLIFAIEAITNERIRDQMGILAQVLPADRLYGPGSTPVMAAFTHIGVATRFSDGTYGVYYAADSTETAIAETVYHREKFLAATHEPDTEITLREYINQVIRKLHDIRGLAFTALHAEDDYGPSQQYGKQKRAQRSYGLIYRSVRRAGGTCVAIFRPKAVTIPIQGKHFRYVWSGHEQRIIKVLTVAEVSLD